MAVRNNLVAILAFLLLSALVQAQFPYGNGGGGDDDDDDNDNAPSSSAGVWPPWLSSRQSPRPAQPTRPPTTPRPSYPWQATSRPTLITVPRPTTFPQLPTSSTRFPWLPVPTVATTRPSQQPAQSTPRWTAPTAWGPNKTKPFGQTETGPQTIPTTTTAAPREPVPFMTNCGRARYVEDDVSNALIAGCYYKNKTRTVAKSEYPRLFDNKYNFNFEPVKGPFFEFPLIQSAPYVGGPPGPDRVIFSESCYLAGEITQTGAGTRGFVACVEVF